MTSTPVLLARIERRRQGLGRPRWDDDSPEACAFRRRELADAMRPTDRTLESRMRTTAARTPPPPRPAAPWLDPRFTDEQRIDTVIRLVDQHPEKEIDS